MYLEELPVLVAAKILESLLPEQMEIIVNYRFRQQDYIGDYLMYVWNLSPQAFWCHIAQTFKSEEGMLVYDSHDVQHILLSLDMPLDVWITLLDFIPTVYQRVLMDQPETQGETVEQLSVCKYELDLLIELLSFQLNDSTQCAEKQTSFCIWLDSLAPQERDVAGKIVNRVFSKILPEWFKQFENAKSIDMVDTI